MKTGRFALLLSATLFVAGQVSLLSAAGQPALVDPARPSTEPAGTNKFAPPPLPSSKPPVQIFRNLLAMSPQERNTFLAKYSPESRKAIAAKLQEYAALPADLRELRLRATELRYYLLPLLTIPATNRAPQLAIVPAELRELIESRLALWDESSPEQQKDFLENQDLLRVLAQAAPTNSSQVLSNLSGEARRTMEAQLDKWESLTPAQRNRIRGEFASYFNLNPEEQKKVLGTISEPERKQIETVLVQIRRLDPVTRAACLRKLDRFVEFTPEERLQFLHSAERWKNLTPEQRQAWRTVVTTTSRLPPLPPGLRMPPPPRAPLPPMPKAPSAAPATVATNL